MSWETWLILKKKKNLDISYHQMWFSEHCKTGCRMSKWFRRLFIMINPIWSYVSNSYLSITEAGGPMWLEVEWEHGPQCADPEWAKQTRMTGPLHTL